MRQLLTLVFVVLVALGLGPANVATRCFNTSSSDVTSLSEIAARTGVTFPTGSRLLRAREHIASGWGSSGLWAVLEVPRKELPEFWSQARLSGKEAIDPRYFSWGGGSLESPRALRDIARIAPRCESFTVPATYGRSGELQILVDPRATESARAYLSWVLY